MLLSFAKMGKLLLPLILIIALVQLSSTMPLFDENGVQEDRGYQTCHQDCQFNRDECLKCPELESNSDDDAIVKCAGECYKKYLACIGKPGTPTSQATGCHNPKIRDRY